VWELSSTSSTQHPDKRFSSEEEQSFVIEEELKKYKDDLGDDYKTLLDFARKLKLKCEAGFVTVCFDGKELEPIEDSAFPQSLHYMLKALFYEKGLASKLRDVERSVKVLGEILFDIKRALKDRELWDFLVELKLRPFNDRLNFMVDKISTIVNALLKVSTEYEEDDFKDLKTGDKTKVVCEVLGWGFTFVRVEPREPTQTSDYYVLDDTTRTLYSLENVIEPVVGALVKKGLASKNLKGEVEVAVKATKLSTTWSQVDPWDKLSLRSGVLDLKTLKLTTGQGYYFRYPPLSINITQEEIDEVRKGRYDIKDNEVYKLWRSHFDDENWDYLIHSLGTWLAPHRSRHIAFIVGPKGSGKSTLLRALTRPIEPVVASLPLSLLTDYTFGLEGLIGKQMNVYSERGEAVLRRLDLINNLVGEHDFIAVPRKYKPTTTIRSLKTMCFAMNDPPLVTEYGGETMAAFLDRLSIIEITRPEDFKPIVGLEVDPKEAFLFLLDSRVRLEENNWEIKKMDEDSMLDYLMKTSNPALQFLESDWIIMDPSAKVKGTELYEAYVAWCKERGLTPMSRNNFYTTVASRFRKRMEEKTTWFRGLMLNPRAKREAESTTTMESYVEG
jgi:energy-coupling factor transporter ATP-binding protein EcfA2